MWPLVVVLLFVVGVVHFRLGLGGERRRGAGLFSPRLGTRSVTIDAAMAPLYVVREGPFTRAIARLGIADEAPVGDRGLDDILFVASDLPENSHRALANPAVLAALSALFEKYEVDRVVAVRGVLSARLVTDTARDSAVADGVREELETIAAALRAEGEHVSPLGLWAFGVTITHLTAVGLALSLLAVQWSDTVVYAGLSLADWGMLGLASVGALALWLGLVFARFDRSAWTVVVLIDFLLWGAAGISGSVVGGALMANTAYDTSAPKPVTASVVGRSCSVDCDGSRRTRGFHLRLSESECLGGGGEKVLVQGKNANSSCRSNGRLTHYVTLEPWAGNSAEADLPVSADVWQRSGHGAKVEIPMRDGALGFDWFDVSGVAVQAPAKPKPAPIIPPGADPSTW